MARVLDTVTMPIKKNGTATPQEYVNNPKSTAPQFSALVAYTVGQIVFNEKKLYRFKTAHPAGAWNAAHVEEITVASELTAHGNDITQLKADFTQLDGKIAATQITNTASGAIASFPDGADDVAVKDLVVDITPVQDLHGQANPYPAGGGKQMLNPDSFTIESPVTVNGVTVVDNKDGSFTINGTATSATNFVILSYRALSEYGITANTNYTLSGFMANKGYIMFGIDGSGTEYRANSDSGVVINVEEENLVLRYRLIIFITNNATFNNEVFKPMLCLSSATDPTTFAPYENICPISGWTGINVVRTGFNQWDEDAEVGGINTANGQTQVDYQRIRSKNFIPCLPGTTYYTNLGFNLFQYDENQNFISFAWQAKGTFTTASNCHYLKFCTATNYGTTYNHDISINYPSTDHDYHAGHVQTVNVDWTTEAGTVYGGTLDVTTGVLTVTMAEVDMGTLSWEKDGNSSNVFYHVKTTEEKAVPCISSNYPRVTGPYNPWSSVPDKSLYSTTGYWIIKDTSYTDAQSLTTALDGAQLVYKIATPVTVQLTPEQVTTLLGLNNIWSDTGDTTVDYRADTKLYIENLTAPTEDDMVANTNIPNGTYFMIGNTLYLSTTTIPAGDTINPGSNCTLMNLAAALNAINA